MSGMSDDPMWSFFHPLWPDLKGVGEDHLLIAGGYGLFLKQTWLLAHPEVLIVVPLGQWRDATPRVTKDFDIVMGLDLIANADAQKGLLAVLQKHGFQVTQSNPRWQFEKPVAENRTIVVELHAPLPPNDRTDLEVDGPRVKRRPSLGPKGIHGRVDSEAIGCNLQPFRFELEGMSIVVTNPVTWCVMKLTAMRDQWARSEKQTRSSESRSQCRLQATKHAKDVCRIMAMVTRDENDAAATVLSAIASSPQFVEAAKIFTTFFGVDDGWGVLATRSAWESTDMQLIRETLAHWFGKPKELSQP